MEARILTSGFNHHDSFNRSNFVRINEVDRNRVLLYFWIRTLYIVPWNHCLRNIYICIRNQQKTQGAAARNSKFLRDKGIDSPIKISSNEEVLGWGHGLFFSINLITRNSFFPGRERAWVGINWPGRRASARYGVRDTSADQLGAAAGIPKREPVQRFQLSAIWLPPQLGLIVVILERPVQRFVLF